MKTCDASFCVNGTSYEEHIQLRGAGLFFLVDTDSALNQPEGAQVSALRLTTVNERRPLRASLSSLPPLVSVVELGCCQVVANKDLGDGRHAVDLHRLEG